MAAAVECSRTSGSGEDAAEMEEQTEAPGVARVKKEYIRKREELYPSDPSDEAPPPPKKRRGQNKCRPHMKPVPASQQLCHSVRQGAECSFGQTCRFSHDVAAFMSAKPPDIGTTCVFYQQWGRCPFGLTCRFGAKHTSPQYTNIVDADKMAAVGAACNVRNVITKELQEDLRRRRVVFPRSETYLKTLDGRGQKVKQQVQVDGRGQEVDGQGQEVDRQSQEVDRRGQEVDGRGQEVAKKVQVDKECQEVEGRGQEAEPGTMRDCDYRVEGPKAVDESCEGVPPPPEGGREGDGPTPEVIETGLKPNQSSRCDSDMQHETARTAGALTDQDEVRLRPQEKKALSFKNKLYLAPLTTVGNLPFRRVCKTLGAEVTCSEMAVCTNLLQGQQAEWALLKRHHSEDIFGAQVCGAFPDTMTKCAELLCQHTEVDFIDINCGCPIDLIFNSGAGSALMKRTKRLEQIVRGMTSVMDVPLTVKMRTGVQDKSWNAHSLVPLLRQWGVAMVTVHGRSREQRYTKLANYDYINRCAAAAAPMPLYGNGDILSFEDYNLRLSSTNASGLMIGRGALIKPWIFTEIKEQRHWDISSHERMDILRQFTDYGLEHWGSDTRGVETTRKFLLEWLSFLHRYIPLGVLERVPQRINERPPYFVGRDDLETLMASGSCSDWIRLSEMLLGPVGDGFSFLPKHRANAYS